MSRRRRARWVSKTIPPLGKILPHELQALRELAKEEWRKQRRKASPTSRPQAFAKKSNESVNPASSTAFADWVFWQLNPDYRPIDRQRTSLQMKWSGEYGHEQIERLKLWIKKDRRECGSFGLQSPWRAVYVDSQNRSEQNTFVASRLKFNGVALKGRPDVVLRDTQTNGIIILERKITHGDPNSIPPSGYANHLCQLWTYAWMDAWNDAPYVMLVLQYWHRDWGKSPWSHDLGVAPVRFREDNQFNRWATNWFTRYGGEFAEHSQSIG